jgi:hypothetical protein
MFTTILQCLRLITGERKASVSAATSLYVCVRTIMSLQCSGFGNDLCTYLVACNYVSRGVMCWDMADLNISTSEISLVRFTIRYQYHNDNRYHLIYRMIR